MGAWRAGQLQSTNTVNLDTTRRHFLGLVGASMASAEAGASRYRPH